MSPAAPPPDAGQASASPEQTERLGAGLGPALKPGDVLLLSGPLGAGKTCFTAGLARGLGCTGRVRSPSFTLINEYEGRIPLVHLDLYRLEGTEAEDLGLDERLERAAMVVEWGERLPAHLRADALTLSFEIRAEQERWIRATATGARGGALLAAWREIGAATGPAR
jgi:tRNA threonylcarbamoyladenosine biosynthesis protein TsaE